MVQRWRGHNAKRSQHFVLFALGLERESRPRRLSWSLGDDNSWSDLEGWRSLGAVAGRRLTPFHGADGADALQGIGRQWHGLVTNDDRWRAAVPRSRGSLTNDSSRLQAETCNRLT